MSSKNDDKGTCELNKHDILPSNEDSEFHEQEGVTFSRLLKVRCYVEIMITLFRRIFNFVTTDVKMNKNYELTARSLPLFRTFHGIFPVIYTLCKYGEPLGRRPGRVA